MIFPERAPLMSSLIKCVSFEDMKNTSIARFRRIYYNLGPLFRNLGRFTTHNTFMGHIGDQILITGYYGFTSSRSRIIDKKGNFAAYHDSVKFVEFNQKENKLSIVRPDLAKKNEILKETSRYIREEGDLIVILKPDWLLYENINGNMIRYAHSKNPTDFYSGVSQPESLYSYTYKIPDKALNTSVETYLLEKSKKLVSSLAAFVKAAVNMTGRTAFFESIQSEPECLETTAQSIERFYKALLEGRYVDALSSIQHMDFYVYDISKNQGNVALRLNRTINSKKFYYNLIPHLFEKR